MRPLAPPLPAVLALCEAAAQADDGAGVSQAEPFVCALSWLRLSPESGGGGGGGRLVLSPGDLFHARPKLVELALSALTLLVPCLQSLFPSASSHAAPETMFEDKTPSIPAPAGAIENEDDLCQDSATDFLVEARTRNPPDTHGIPRHTHSTQSGLADAHYRGVRVSAQVFQPGAESADPQRDAQAASAAIGALLSLRERALDEDEEQARKHPRTRNKTTFPSHFHDISLTFP